MLLLLAEKVGSPTWPALLADVMPLSSVGTPVALRLPERLAKPCSTHLSKHWRCKAKKAEQAKHGQKLACVCCKFAVVCSGCVNCWLHSLHVTCENCCLALMLHGCLLPFCRAAAVYCLSSAASEHCHTVAQGLLLHCYLILLCYTTVLH